MNLRITHLYRNLNQIQYCGRYSRFLSHYHEVDNNVIGVSEKQVELRKTIFNLVKNELAPKAYEIDKTDNFEEFRSFWKLLGKVGALGITSDRKYGGTEGSVMDHVIITEEISRGSGAIGASYISHSEFCINQISRHGTEEQKQKYLPKLCSGEHIGALAMSEAGSGSDIVSMKLRAEKIGDHYILNGTKFWTTNGFNADVLVVFAKTDQTKQPQHGITTFIIENTFKGFSACNKLDKLELRGSNTCELLFEDCVVPEENVLDVERLIVSGVCIGLAQAACDLAFSHVHERKLQDEKISEFEMIKDKLYNMDLRLKAGRCYLYNVIKAYDMNHINSRDSAGVVNFTSQSGTKSALDVIQILGKDGYLNDSPAGRILRDAKLFEIGGGTVEIRKILIGKALNKEYT